MEFQRISNFVAMTQILELDTPGSSNVLVLSTVARVIEKAVTEGDVGRTELVVCRQGQDKPTTLRSGRRSILGYRRTPCRPG